MDAILKKISLVFTNSGSYLVSNLSPSTKSLAKVMKEKTSTSFKSYVEQGAKSVVGAIELTKKRKNW